MRRVVKRGSLIKKKNSTDREENVPSACRTFGLSRFGKCETDAEPADDFCTRQPF